MRNNFIKRIIYTQRYKPKFAELKGKYNNHSCFIIGNGPSLSSDDILKIKDYYTFGSNRIFKYENQTQFKPDFYFVQDSKLLKSKDILNYIDSNSNKIKIFIPFHKSTKKLRREHTDIKYYNLVFYKDLQSDDRCFSLKADSRFCEGGTVTYSMIQAAVFLGFKKIYLIGIDNTRKVDGTTIHFYDYVNTSTIESYTLTKSYKKAQELLNGKVEVYNCTRGGKLEVFPRKTIEEIIQNDEYKFL